MSIRHAANRFRKTPIDGWDGTAWITEVTFGSFLSVAQPIEEKENRTLLINPEYDLPDNISLIRVGPSAQIYLVGRRAVDIRDSSYRDTVNLQRAFYTCVLQRIVSQTAPSGMKIAPIKTPIANYYCDVQILQNIPSKVYSEVTINSSLVTLPRDAQIETTNELIINGDVHEVEAVYNSAGFVCCKCKIQHTPLTDTRTPL